MYAQNRINYNFLGKFDDNQWHLLLQIWLKENNPRKQDY